MVISFAIAGLLKRGLLGLLPISEAAENISCGVRKEKVRVRDYFIRRLCPLMEVAAERD